MIHLAYDGSINGDWVAWYAVNLARHEPDRQLKVIHVNTGEIQPATLREKSATLARLCEDAGVGMSFDMVPSGGPGAEHVFRSLLAHVPAGDETLLLCGARISGEDRGYLSGSVSARLLGDNSFGVMALRVVQPGLLGAPSHFLLPVAGEHTGFLVAAGILRRFIPNITRVNLLRVMVVKRQLFRRLLGPRAAELRNRGREGLSGLGDELAKLTGIDSRKIDTSVSVSDDWALEVIIAASRYKSHLILMEASKSDLQDKMPYGGPIEVVLRDAPCDVAIYRGA